MKTPDTKVTGVATTLRHLDGVGRHLRSNAVAYLALVVAVGSGGSYAFAATANSGTIAVCVDRGSGVARPVAFVSGVFTCFLPSCGHWTRAAYWQLQVPAPVTSERRVAFDGVEGLEPEFGLGEVCDCVAGEP